MKLNDNIEKVEEDIQNLEEGQEVAQVTKRTAVKVIKTKEEVAIIAEEDLELLIPKWKAEYGKVYKNFINDKEFVIWRPIKRKEYKALLENKDSYENNDVLSRQEEFAKIAILYPSDVDEIINSRAGIATLLSEEILKYSGFEISETESL